VDTFGWSVFTNGPYMDMLVGSGLFAPKRLGDGTFVFAAPIGKGHVSMIALEDLAFYVDYIFSNPDKTVGRDIAVATEDVTWEHLAKTFTEVTGQKAIAMDLTNEQYFVTSHLRNLTIVPFQSRSKSGHGRP
jgi:uncharacterized protein YbjT (DUF2867 family)